MQNNLKLKRNILLIAGFLFFVTGFLSIILSMIGFKFDFLSFLINLGSGFAFLIYIFMVIAGIAMMYVAKTPVYKEEKEKILH